MSFDIECHSFGKFPDAQRHQINTIGFVCQIHGEERYQHKVVLQLKETELIAEADVYYFDTEELLIKAFDLLLENYDPDVLTGYNILSFDLKYILD